MEDDARWRTDVAQKLDKLMEAVTTLARIEEKLYFANQRTDRLEKVVDAENGRIDQLTLQVTTLATSSSITDKGFWLIAGCGVSAAIMYFLR